MKKNKITKKSEGAEIRDQYTVVLEGIRSDIKGIGEGIAMANEKMDEEFKKTNENLQLMRTEVSLIRHNQITRDEFKFLEDRVFNLEKKIEK
jgi:hypothetical protein